MNYSNEIAELNFIKSNLPRGVDGRVLYTNEFRARVVELFKSSKICDVARDLNINATNLCNWKTGKKLHGFKSSKAVAMQRKKADTDAVQQLLKRKSKITATILSLGDEVEKIEKAIKLLRELGV